MVQHPQDRNDLMDEKLICPKVPGRDTPPRDDDLMDEACRECPGRMRQVDERGVVTFYCLVYHNRFRSAGPIPIRTPAPSKAAWSRERFERS
jgi:hypothetical protein